MITLPELSREAPWLASLNVVQTHAASSIRNIVSPNRERSETLSALGMGVEQCEWNNQCF